MDRLKLGLSFFCPALSSKEMFFTHHLNTMLGFFGIKLELTLYDLASTN